MMPGQLGGAPSCPVCNERVYFSEGKDFMRRSWHLKCFKCSHCRKALDSSTANLVDDGTIACNTCYRKLFPGNKVTTTKRQDYVNHDDPDCCPRCGKRVYFAEQLLSLGRKWHKMCFTCDDSAEYPGVHITEHCCSLASCKKRLDSSSVRDHDSELYCSACHTRQFGPKGYGFAGGAGTGLSMDTGHRHKIPTGNIPHTAEAYVAPVAEKLNDIGLGENEGRNGDHDDIDGLRAASDWVGTDCCPRCRKQVFIAEKRQAAGNCYHETCFTCFLCNKKLDSTKLTEKEGEIFCKVCYGKKFGPKGYGFGVGAGTLQMI